jgi:hypothetical protein
VEVVHAVLGQPRSGRIVDEPPLIEGRSAHPALNALDDVDVLNLQHLIMYRTDRTSASVSWSVSR